MLWLYKLTNLILFAASTGLIIGWTYFEAAVNHFQNEQKPFSYFLWIWCGTGLLVLIRTIWVERDIAGRMKWSIAWRVKLVTLCQVAFCAGFTLHALAAVTPEFDIDHLNMPFFLPALYIPLHFGLVIWLLFTNGRSHADRGLFLLLIFHTLNGALFNAEFYLIAGLACITLVQAFIENQGRWHLPPLFIGAPLLVLILLTLFATWKGMNPINAAPALSNVGVCVAIFALVVGKPRQERFMLKILGVMLFAACLVFIAAAGMIASVGNVLGPLPALTSRLSIFYQHPNFLAPYFALIFFLALGLAFVPMRIFYRVISAGLSLAALAALRLTDSRAGLLGFLAGACIFVLLAPPIDRFLIFCLKRLSPKAKRLILIAGAVVLVGSAGMAIKNSDSLLSAAKSSTRIQRALDYRMDAWTNSLEIIKANKLHGIGLNTFLSVKKFPPGSKFAHESTAPHPHNLLLYIAQSIGIPALAIFLILLAAYLYFALRLYLKVESLVTRRTIAGCLAATVVLMTCGLMDLGLALSTLFPGPLWLFMAIVSCFEVVRRNRIRSIRFSGPSTVLVVGVLAAAFIAGFVRPTTARLLLSRTALIPPHEDSAVCLSLGEQALAVDPLYEKAREYLLRRYLVEDRKQEAFTLVEESISLQPNNAANYKKLGDLLYESERYDDARAQYLTAIEKDHGSIDLPGIYAQLINAEAKCADTKSVKDHLKTAITRNIDVINMIAWSVQPHPDGRDDKYLEIVQADTTVRLEEALDEIFDALKAGEEQGLAQDRFDWFSLFHAYFNSLIYDQALLVLDEIERIFGEPERASVLCLKAVIFRDRGELEKSKALFDQAYATGDRTFPAATLFYHSHSTSLEETSNRADYERVIEDHKNTLANLRDYVSSYKAFILAYDQMIEIHEAYGEQARQIDPLIQRLFFISDKGERLPFLLRLALAYHAAGRLTEAEETLLETLDGLASRQKRMAELEVLQRREPVVKIALQLAAVYDSMNLSAEQALARIERKTDFFSSNPCRLLFKCHFLVRTGLPVEAINCLRLVFLDEEHLLFLLQLASECYQMIDDLAGLRENYQAIDAAYRFKGIDLETRATGLMGTVMDNLDNIELILELARTKSYAGQHKHAISLLNEAGNKYHPDEPRIFWLAARIHRLDNQPRMAKEALAKVMALDPADIKARIALAHLEAHLRDSEPDPGGTREGP